jgi:isopentenyl diphosphate isomerase/L-lactate dehydrogenase-like FMN-dependent dehydrogenase
MATANPYWGAPRIHGELAVRQNAIGCGKTSWPAASVATGYSIVHPVRNKSVTTNSFLRQKQSTGCRPKCLPYLILDFGDAHLANYFADPAFRAKLAEPPEKDLAAAVRLWLSLYSNTSLTWDDLDFLRRRTRMPILLKGILHPDDARKAFDCGMDGIIVSNHGGRQVDGAIAALDALVGVVEAVQGRGPVLFDSGIRHGADAFKALALGAKAVLLGRTYIWGLAVAGEEGVREVVSNFLAELDLTFALSGCASLKELDSSALAREGS